LTALTAGVIIMIDQISEQKRIESKLEVQTYLDRLKYVLYSGSVTINFQKDRQIDSKKDNKYTNRYTLAQLFPNEDEVEVLKRELSVLSFFGVGFGFCFSL
jgi:hypothetical protein